MEFKNVEIEKARINNVQINERTEEIDEGKYKTNYTVTVNATVFLKAPWGYEAYWKGIGIKSVERKVLYVENTYLIGDDMTLHLIRDFVDYPRHHDDNHFYKGFIKNEKEDDSYYNFMVQNKKYYEEERVKELEKKIELWLQFKEKMSNYIIEEMKKDGFELEDTKETKRYYGDVHESKYYF